MIGVIVPAHNEARLIGACLASIDVAAACPGLRGEPVQVVVAADACTDGTAHLAVAAGASVVTLADRNVGSARRAATDAAIAGGADWIASTDADSRVAPDWLLEQLLLREEGYDAVCGVVHVEDWLDHPPRVRTGFRSVYADTDGHAHVHGACFGVSSAAYLAVGGWQRLALHEDVTLVDVLAATGHRVARSRAVRVATSARRDARAAGGFGDYLAALDVSA